MIELKGCCFAMDKQDDFEEDEYYDEILGYFTSDEVEEKEKEVWKNSKLVELMELIGKSEKGSDNLEAQNLVQNAIILLLALSDNNTPDFYDQIGKDAKSISNEEYELLKRELRSEFEF